MFLSLFFFDCFFCVSNCGVQRDIVNKIRRMCTSYVRKRMRLIHISRQIYAAENIVIGIKKGMIEIVMLPYKFFHRDPLRKHDLLAIIQRFDCRIVGIIDGNSACRLIIAKILETGCVREKTHGRFGILCVRIDGYAPPR